MRNTIFGEGAMSLLKAPSSLSPFYEGTNKKELSFKIGTLVPVAGSFSEHWVQRNLVDSFIIVV